MRDSPHRPNPVHGQHCRRAVTPHGPRARSAPRPGNDPFLPPPREHRAVAAEVRCAAAGADDLLTERGAGAARYGKNHPSERSRLLTAGPVAQEWAAFPIGNDGRTMQAGIDSGRGVVLPADLPPARLAPEPSDSLDPVEWEGTEPRASGDRHASHIRAITLAALTMIGLGRWSR
jgi:hypothetical protein